MATTKTATKKTATKKTAAKRAPAKKASTANKETSRQVARKAAARSTANGNGQATGRSIQVHARQVASHTAQTAGALAERAKTKAHDLTQRSKSFVREHPAEAAGLAVAGLTVLGAILGRGKLAPVIKGVAGTALVAKLGEALSKRR